MRLTPRRRAVIAVLLSWPLGYYYLDWATYTGLNIIRHYRSGYVDCDGSWRSYFNSCTAFSATVAWVELIVATVAGRRHRLAHRALGRAAGP